VSRRILRAPIALTVDGTALLNLATLGAPKRIEALVKLATVLLISLASWGAQVAALGWSAA
jgi:hypothetical protein